MTVIDTLQMEKKQQEESGLIYFGKEFPVTLQEAVDGFKKPFIIDKKAQKFVSVPLSHMIWSVIMKCYYAYTFSGDILKFSLHNKDILKVTLT